MKILIYVLCFFANALITAFIKEGGIILGGIPTALMFGGTLWVAHILCKKWDEHKANKVVEENISVQEFNPVVEANSDQVRFCRKCGEKLIDSSKFCRKCGTEIIEEKDS